MLLTEFLYSLSIYHFYTAAIEGSQLKNTRYLDWHFGELPSLTSKYILHFYACDEAGNLLMMMFTPSYSSMPNICALLTL